MSQLGCVGVGLSIAFGLFMVVLVVELLHMWRSGQKRREAAVSNCATQAKQVQWSTTWRHMVADSWSVLGSKEVKRWAKLCLHNRLWQREQTGASREDGGREEAKEMTLEQGRKQEGEAEAEEEEAEEEDVFRVGGLWGPPRLLFTIKEETKEEMEQLEEARSPAAAGKGSRCGSCASSEVLYVDSACSSPFVTPPSSPPFATPFGSPAPHLPLCSASRRHAGHDVYSSSSSTSSSSPPLRRPLSALFEDSSSFSSSSTATPATLSPLAHPLASVSSPIKRHRHPLCLLLDPPPLPSSALYHYQNRVYPLTSPNPPHGNVQVSANDLVKPAEKSLSPFSPFHLPAPRKPTTPCPFRALKSTGMAVLSASPPTSHRADDQL